MESDIFIHNGKEPKKENYIRFLCISDTHSRYVPLPEADVLIHSGDFTKKGTQQEV